MYFVLHVLNAHTNSSATFNLENFFKQSLVSFGKVRSAEFSLFVQFLHSCFSHWYTLVVEIRARLGKAAAIGDWKLLLRVWQAWRAFVSGRRVRRERDQVARELQREKM